MAWVVCNMTTSVVSLTRNQRNKKRIVNVEKEVKIDFARFMKCGFVLRIES